MWYHMYFVQSFREYHPRSLPYFKPAVTDGRYSSHIFLKDQIPLTSSVWLLAIEWSANC